MKFMKKASFWLDIVAAIFFEVAGIILWTSKTPWVFGSLVFSFFGLMIIDLSKEQYKKGN